MRPDRQAHGGGLGLPFPICRWIDYKLTCPISVEVLPLENETISLFAPSVCILHQFHRERVIVVILSGNHIICYFLADGAHLHFPVEFDRLIDEELNHVRRELSTLPCVLFLSVVKFTP